MTLSWDECQSNSDKILSEGTSILIKSTPCELETVANLPGVYLFSHLATNYYIGQADNLKKRLKSQRSKRSTYYKSYLNSEYTQTGLLQQEDFQMRTLTAQMGRKELEEFCIVNLDTPLNKFHRNKRRVYPVSWQSGIWEQTQQQRSDLLTEGDHFLFTSEMEEWNKAKIEKVPGIYFVLDSSDRLIYIGESTNVQRRHHMHSNRTYMSALRRHIGTELLGFKFVGKNSFSQKDDQAVNEFLSSCTIGYRSISLGRLELEEYVIKSRDPLLNRKANKR